MSEKVRDLLRVDMWDTVHTCCAMGGGEDGPSDDEVRGWADALYAEVMALLGPIAVTVDDEHAQPVTGWVLRLPEEFKGAWAVIDPWDREADCWSVAELGAEAALKQEYAALDRESGQRFDTYETARWWAEAYRTVLREEAQR